MNTTNPTLDAIAHAAASATEDANVILNEYDMLKELRQRQRERRKDARKTPQTLGGKIADRVAQTVGSWNFVIIQSVLLGAWIILNLVMDKNGPDPYPFILLNLMLSFQAAYTAPIIMMSQNRQAKLDKIAAQQDYDTNMKAELEVEWLHMKMDVLRQQEIARLLRVVEDLSQTLADNAEKDKQEAIAANKPN